MHFPADPDHVQQLLPSELTVETFPDEYGQPKAWIGLVTFSMKQIRPPGFPAVPWLSAFLETNVRTYVRHNGHMPGVWFFSLDAERLLACVYAREVFGLNYLHSVMRSWAIENEHHYSVRRLEEPQAELALSYETFKAENRIANGKFAQPRTFEFWLCERYLLYSKRGSELLTGRVWHRPYSLWPATVNQLEQTLITSQGLRTGELAHVVYSPGIDVEVFSPIREIY